MDDIRGTPMDVGSLEEFIDESCSQTAIVCQKANLFCCRESQESLPKCDIQLVLPQGTIALCLPQWDLSAPRNGISVEDSPSALPSAGIT